MKKFDDLTPEQQLLISEFDKQEIFPALQEYFEYVVDVKIKEIYNASGTYNHEVAGSAALIATGVRECVNRLISLPERARKHLERKKKEAEEAKKSKKKS